MSLQSNNHVSKKKRTKYTTRACDYCKQRHLKCNGDVPCAQCSKRQINCAYTQKNVKRGPKPKKSVDENQRMSEKMVDVESATKLRGELDRYKMMLQEWEQKYFELLKNNQPKNCFAIPELSKELIMQVYQLYIDKVFPVFPHSFKTSSALCFQVIKKLAMNTFVLELGDTIQYLVHCIIFAHGLRINGNQDLSSLFIVKAESYIQYLFNNPRITEIPNQFLSVFANDLISCLYLFSYYKVQSGEFDIGRQALYYAYNILNMYVNEVNPSISHRIYANMAGMARSTIDMTHWIDNAHLLGIDANTPINRVYSSLLFCSPSLLRDPKNKPLPSNIYVPDVHNLSQEDLMLYQRMLIEFDETEEIIMKTESGSCTQNDVILTDYINSFKMIIYGCRALVLTQCSCIDQAIVCAETSIKYACSLKKQATFFSMALGLSYALLVCKCIGNNELLNMGYPILESYKDIYPLIKDILIILQEKDEKVDQAEQSKLPDWEAEPNSNINNTIVPVALEEKI
jgi:hypothetical protein